MALILKYASIDEHKLAELESSLAKLGFVGGGKLGAISRPIYWKGGSSVAFSLNESEVVLNDDLQCGGHGDVSVADAQTVLDDLVRVLQPTSWGSNLGRLPKVEPPKVYAHYRLDVPFDPNIF